MAGEPQNLLGICHICYLPKQTEAGHLFCLTQAPMYSVKQAWNCLCHLLAPLFILNRLILIKCPEASKSLMVAVAEVHSTESGPQTIELRMFSAGRGGTRL